MIEEESMILCSCPRKEINKYNIGGAIFFFLFVFSLSVMKVCLDL